jgi:hypothetical protein
MTELERGLRDGDGKTHTVRELRARVSLLEPRIIAMRELNSGAPATLDTMGEVIRELSEELNEYCIVVDLTEARGSITSEYRRYIPEFFDKLYARPQRLRHIGLVFHANPVVRVVTKFMVARITKIPFSIYKSTPLALEGLRAELRTFEATST